MADIGDGERSDFNFIDIKRMIPLENTLVIRAQIAYYIDSEDTLIGKLFFFTKMLDNLDILPVIMTNVSFYHNDL